MKPTRLKRTALLGVAVAVLTSLFSNGVVTAPYSGTIPGSDPRFWLETEIHEDQSSSRLLVFQTIPGVIYRVEESRDLVEWDTVSDHQGGGQEIAVPVVQIAAPPEPPDPQDPPQVRCPPCSRSTTG